MERIPGSSAAKSADMVLARQNSQGNSRFAVYKRAHGGVSLQGHLQAVSGGQHQARHLHRDEDEFDLGAARFYPKVAFRPLRNSFSNISLVSLLGLIFNNLRFERSSSSLYSLATSISNNISSSS